MIRTLPGMRATPHHMEKIIPKGLLVIYVVILIWLILFKFSHHISPILDHQQRSLNLIPFGAPKIVNGRISLGEAVYNFLFFVPLGLLLGVNFKKSGFLPKLYFVLLFSLTAELIQYIFAIGATDITDLITNTAGGFLGLKLYSVSKRFIAVKKLDNVIITISTLLLLSFLLLEAVHLIRRH
jgi:glycopeptide antibiotics resistance protein